MTKLWRKRNLLDKADGAVGGYGAAYVALTYALTPLVHSLYHAISAAR